VCAWVGLAALVVVLGACSRPGSSGEPRAPAQVVGVVVDVESAGLGEVESFTVKDGDETFEIFIDAGATYSFPPSHLYNHRATSQPVRVRMIERSGRLLATSIEDA
jgi:hypothetical protein